MNKPLSQQEITNIEAIMDRKEKLLRLVQLVRDAEEQLGLYYGLEYWNEHSLRYTFVKDHYSALGVAARDPVFQAAGLSDNPSVEDMMKFLELSQTQLHEFSCGCDGIISHEEMAKRIESLI